MSRGRTTVVGLVRHRATEPGDQSSSTVFGQQEAALAAAFDVRRLPACEDEPLPVRRRLLADLVRSSDVVFTDLSPCVLETRNQVRPELPLVLRTLGDLGKVTLALWKALPLLRSTDTLLFASAADLEIFRRLVRRTPAATRVVPYAVDTATFRPGTGQERRAVRERLGYGTDDVVFLYAGRLASDKNVHGVLQVLEPLARRDPRVRLLIAGNAADEMQPWNGVGLNDIGRLLGDVLERCQTLRARTRMVPAVSHRELAELHRAADVFLSWSLAGGEDFGYAPVEAMSSGLPAVVTDWEGMRATVVHGETGFRVDTVVTGGGVRYDAAQAYGFCARLAGDEGLRLRLGAGARRRALERYAPDVYRRALTETVAEALSRPRGTKRRAGLTPFGKSFRDAFQGRFDRRDLRGRFATFTPATHGLYREYIRPACTRAAVEAAPGDILWPAVLSWRRRGGRLSIVDPMCRRTWPLSRSAASVLRAVESGTSWAEPFVRFQDLDARLGTSRQRRALATLIRRGVVGSSAAKEAS